MNLQKCCCSKYWRKLVPNVDKYHVNHVMKTIANHEIYDIGSHCIEWQDLDVSFTLFSHWKHTREASQQGAKYIVPWCVLQLFLVTDLLVLNTEKNTWRMNVLLWHFYEKSQRSLLFSLFVVFRHSPIVNVSFDYLMLTFHWYSN